MGGHSEESGPAAAIDMSARIIKRHSRLANWAKWIALFCGQLLLVGVALHRFEAIGSPELTNLLAVAIAGAMTGLLLSVVALVRIWSRGTLGVGPALTAFFICLLMLAGPLWHLPSLLFKPKINQIVTDPLDRAGVRGAERQAARGRQSLRLSG